MIYIHPLIHPAHIRQGAIITNYPADGSRNADGTPYGGNRIAGPVCYPAGTAIRFHLPRGSVVGVVHDRERRGSLHGQTHFDFPCRFFERSTGLPSRGGAVGTLEHIRYEVIRSRKARR